MAAPRLRIVRRQRRISRLLAWLLAPFVSAFAFAQTAPVPGALPQGGQIKVGAGQLTQTGQLLLIQQSTPRLGLDWQRFEIGSDATVRFQQPGRSAIAFNRVLGNDPSAIFGRLEANGQVFLSNPNGVLFAPGSKVDVGGLVASTLDLSQDDFEAGRYQFAGTGGTVLNLGQIAAEGYVALFGGAVDNQGTITTAPGGNVVLAAGRAATVALSDSGLISAVVVPAGPVSNSGQLEAAGGQLTLTGALVNNSGLVRASSIVERGGEIHIVGDQVASSGRLEADGTAGGRIVVRGDMLAGRADIGGTLSAQAAGGGDGGRIETSAAFVAIDPATRVNTLAASGRHGEWLIDPTDFVVGAGGGAQTTSGIGATTLATNLQSGNVTLQTAPTGSEPGDIRVEAAVSWSAGTVLTLSAANDVVVRADIRATGNAAGLTVSAGSGRFAIEDGARIDLPGSSPRLSINGEPYVVINSLAALQAIGDDGTTLNRNYALGSHIDASATAGWNDGAGFLPIGNGNYFYGDFDGLGHRITGLTINRPGHDYTGLFGLTYDTSIRHLALSGGSIVGGYSTGAVAGYMQGHNLGTRPALQGVSSDLPVHSLMTNSSSTFTGGLVGRIYNGGGGIVDSHATGTVAADSYYGYTGGLIGYLSYAGVVADSTATGAVRQVSTAYGSTYGRAGGLVGYAEYSPMRDVSASGAVAGGDITGGLIGETYGRNDSGVQPDAIQRASASGAVASSSGDAGGLIGRASNVPISDASASGDVTSSGGSYVGGLVGYLASAGITNGSASGNVTTVNSSYVGGLVGYANSADITNGSASGDVSATSSSSAGGLVGRARDAVIGGSIATGTVAGAYQAGGLVGQFDGGSGAILDSRATGAVSGSGTVGGLVGDLTATNQSADEHVVIARSHASGDVETRSYGGGLVGQFSGSGVIFEDSGATGNVTGVGVGSEGSSFYLGGLIGYHYDYSDYYRYYYGYAAGEIRRTYASGTVSVADGLPADRYVYAYGGGLIGYLVNYYYNYLDDTSLHIRDSYATGAVDLRATRGQAFAGGLIGLTGEVGLENVYASGAISATGFDTRATGGLVASAGNGGSVVVDNGYWNQTSTGQIASAGGGTPLSDAQMRQAASFTGWDIGAGPGTGSTWRIYEGRTQPLLRGLLTPLAVTLGDASKTYDGTASFGDSGIAANGGGAIARPEQILVAGLSKDVGTTAITAAALYSTQQGYDLDASGAGNFTVAPRTVTLDGVVAGKVYDGGVAAGFVAGAQPVGLIAGEDLSIGLGSASAAFADKNAATGKGVTVTGYTVGDGAAGKAANYTVVGSATADITPRPVNAGGFEATDRVYDGTTTVAVSFAAAALTGRVAGDDLALVDSGATGTLADKSAGSDRPVTIGGVTLSGADAANYRLEGLDSTTVTISPKPVTVNGIVASDRSYNGNTSVSVSGNSATTMGLLDADLVEYSAVNLSGQMADRHVGTDKPVTVSGLTLVGPDAANYAPQAGGVTVDITPRQLTASVSTLYNSALGNYGWKLYDGSADASAVARATVSGLVAEDEVTLVVGSVTFADKNVAYGTNGAVANRTITASGLALEGTFTGNYVLTNASATNNNGRILPRPLTVSGVSALDRVYDGTVDVQVSVDGATVDTAEVVPGDDVSVTIPGGGAITGTMADKHVGTNKPVTVPGLVLGGADGANYTLTGSDGVTVDITRKDLRAGYTAQDRAYDGTTRVVVNATSADIVAGDVVHFYQNNDGAYYCQTNVYYCYANYTGDGAKNVGTNKPISISYDSIYGSDAGNYNFINASSGTATGTVTTRAITPAVMGVDKVYDGSTAASVTLDGSGSGIVSGDSVEIATQHAIFTGGKNVGTGKAIAVTDITLSGTDAGNYALAASTAATTADITPKPVAVSGISAVDRVYDGTLVVQVEATAPEVSGLVVGDDVSTVLPVGGISSGTLLDRHAGQAKPISVTGLTLAGADAANYSLSGSAGTVNIAPKPITVSYTGIDKVYDGTVTANVTGASDGIVAGVGDVVGFAQTAVFGGDGARNAGTDKPILVSDIQLTGAQAGNYVLEATTAEASADITPRPIGVSYVGVARPYNGAADVSATVLGSASGLIAGDSVGLNQTARFAGDGRAGSNKTVDISDITLAGVNAGNYELTTDTASTTASITPKLLGVTGMDAVDRVYDGTTVVQVAVTAAQVDLTGVIAGDVVSVSLPPEGITTGAMLDKHVGQDKPVSVTGLLLGGADAANYALTGEGALTVDISALAISAAFTGVNKVYDGGTGASVIGSSNGFAAGDLVGISATAAFTGDGAKNVGTDKAISVSNAFLTGADRFNYVLSNRDGSTTADITPRPLLPQYTGGSREYDGSVTAPFDVVLDGRVGSDQLVLTQNAIFTGAGAKNVGTGKPIAISEIVLGGADAGNYQLAYDSATASGTITPRQIVVEGLAGIVATPRTYDGTVNVAVTVPAGLTGTPRAGDVLAGELVTVNVPAAGATTGTMADKNAGTDKPVLVAGLGLAGPDAANYMIASAQGVTVDITPLAIAAVYAGIDKIYDGTAAAQVTVSLPGRLDGDVLTGSASGLFAGGKNAGTGKEVTVSGGALAGTDALNYTLSNPGGSTTADILQRQVTAAFTGIDKVYDGTAAAQVSGSIDGLIAGDSVALTQSAVFTAGKNVGSDKAVAVSGIALDGSDAGNYRLASATAGTSASITPRPVVIEGLTVSAQGREYDGTTTVAVQVQASTDAGPRAGDVIDGDDLTVAVPSTGATTGTMADKHAGTGKAIVVAGLALSGADAINYQITGTAGLTVDIAPRTLTATWTGVDKVYDGTAAASASGSGDRVVGGDELTIAGSGIFSAGRNAGTGLAIEIQSALLGGADAANYSLDNPTGSATASITPKTLSVSYAGGSRVYDGGTAAPVIGLLDGVIGSDEVLLSQTAVFSDGKNVGTDKPVAISAIALAGADAGNYRSPIAATTTSASVTPRPIVIDGLSATAASREYDGTATVAVDVIAAGGVAPRPGDVIEGDVVTVGVPAAGQTVGTMADKHVGTGKAVVIDGLVLSGTDAPNYVIEGVGGVTVDITPRELTATWTGQDKIYDGSDLATALGIGDRVVAGDVLTLLADGIFTAGKNVGSGLAIELQSGVLGGADAGNYVLLNPTGATTASILQRTVTAAYTGIDKVYDGGTAAGVTGELQNLVEGETLTLAQSAVFADGKNVGAAKPVLIAGITISGAEAGNYRLASTEASATASVTPRPILVTGLAGLAAQDRVYDGTRTVALSGSAGSGLGLEGTIAGDDVQLAQDGITPGVGTMADKHVGSDKAVVVEGLTLAGADAGNYELGGSVGLTVTITPRPVTASGLVAQDRLYDGTLSVVLDTSAAALGGVLAGDDLRLLVSGATGTVADKNAGQGKAVIVAGAAFEGADAGNYTLQADAALTVDIAPRPLTLTAQGLEKIYGEAPVFSGSEFAADGLVEGETVGRVSLSSPGAAATAGVGSYLLSISDASGGSFDPANYVLSYQAAALLVNPRALTLSALLQSKRYGDVLGFVSGDVVVGGQGLANGETLGSVQLASAGALAAAGVGTYGITITGFSGGSFDPANYIVSYQAGELTVTPRPLTIAAQTVVRYEDEPNPATFGFATPAGGLVNGDALASVQTPVPAGSDGAPGGSIFTLVPGGAQFASGSAANYVLTYLNGRLIVLPKPPSIDDPDGGASAGGGDVLLVVLTPEQQRALEIALREQVRYAGRLDRRIAVDTAPDDADEPRVDPAAVLAALLRGETQQVSLDTLQRLPLISLDPVLLRMLQDGTNAR